MGFGDAINLQGDGVGIATNGGEGVVQLCLELGKVHHDGVDGFEEFDVAAQFCEVDGAGQVVGVAGADFERFLHEGAAFVAHFGQPLFGFGGQFEHEGQLFADGGDRGGDLGLVFWGKRTADVVRHHKKSHNR